jgi:hypothetical protein
MGALRARHPNAILARVHDQIKPDRAFGYAFANLLPISPKAFRFRWYRWYRADARGQRRPHPG